jgi:glycosidase
VSGAVWLCPIYPSPFRDFGYHISDFCAVDPMYGTLADFDRLVEQLNGSGMSLLFDFVPNHTSDTYPWFRERRASRDAPKRDWYVRADEPGWRATQQLAQPLRRQRLGMGRTERPILTTTPSDEIGMAGVDIPPDASTIRSRTSFPALASTCDPERAPMRWTADEHGGFTSGQPWLPMENDVGRSLPAEPVHGRRAGGDPLRQNPKNP